MKKLALVMVSALIIIVFIAFNYLLWDNENKEKDIENLKYLNISSNTRINAYEREIKSLEEEIKQIRESLKTADDANKNLLQEKSQLEVKIEEFERLLEEKIELINVLKQHVDIKLLEAPVREWIDSINKGDYETAYELLSKQIANQYKNLSFAEFKSNYENTIKEMKLESVNLLTDDVPDDIKGSIVFEIVVDVVILDEAEKNPDGFKAGQNRRFVTVDFDKENEKWVITGISSSL
ncbi:MAG TPA: coiled-coil domain-containing protein 22 [Clostridiaceae bacterium]|nr:coiled-coil domain-containing protein 22 [Clostridiaceae bacterium]